MMPKLSPCKSSLIPEHLKLHELNKNHFEKVEFLDHVQTMVHHAKNQYANDKEILMECKHLQQISPFRRKGRSSPFNSINEAQAFATANRAKSQLRNTKLSRTLLPGISSIMQVNSAIMDTNMSEKEMVINDSVDNGS
jgi:hypothetical protein